MAPRYYLLLFSPHPQAHPQGRRRRGRTTPSPTSPDTALCIPVLQVNRRRRFHPLLWSLSILALCPFPMATPIPNTRINCLPCLASFITLFLAILACIPPFAVGQSSDSSPPAVTPSAFTTIVGESATFTVVDSSGRPVSDAQWSVDPPLAELTVENGEAVLTPNQAGRAIVTANFGNQSASASLLILSGPSLPQGTVRWSVLPLRATRLSSPAKLSLPTPRWFFTLSNGARPQTPSSAPSPNPASSSG